MLIGGNTVYKKWAVFEQFQSEVGLSVVSFYNFQWTLNSSISGLLLFFWKACKFELPVYSLTCSVGVGIKFVFSIEGVGCEVTGLKGRSLVTGGSTSKTIWWHIIKLIVTTSCILIYNGFVSISRTDVKSQGTGSSPSYYERSSRLLS